MLLPLLGEVTHASRADDGTWLLVPKPGFAGLWCCAFWRSELVRAPPLVFWAGANDPLPDTATRESLADFFSFWETAALPCCCRPLPILSCYFGHVKCSPARCGSLRNLVKINRWSYRVEVFSLRKSSRVITANSVPHRPVLPMPKRGRCTWGHRGLLPAVLLSP